MRQVRIAGLQVDVVDSHVLHQVFIDGRTLGDHNLLEDEVVYIIILFSAVNYFSSQCLLSVFTYVMVCPLCVAVI